MFFCMHCGMIHRDAFLFGLLCIVAFKMCFQTFYFTDFPGPKVCIFCLNTWVSFLFPAAHNQMPDYLLWVTSAFHSKHKMYSKKKNQIDQMLLLDSFLNSNTNTFNKSWICIHIYLIYCTVHFSFQSFAEFLFFLPLHRSWYSISRTLTNAGL